MDESELIKMIGSGGIAVGALVYLARICWRVGERMIGTIDQLREKSEENTRQVIAALHEIQVEMATLRERTGPVRRIKTRSELVGDTDEIDPDAVKNR